MGAEINGIFVSLSRRLHLRPRLGIERKGEVCPVETLVGRRGEERRERRGRGK